MTHLRRQFVAALGALFLLASPAAAKPPAPAPTACPAPGTLTQVFLPWADPAFYFLAPDGSFESRAWSGGTLAAGNEPHFVRSSGDRRSMTVRSAVTSPAICVGLEEPTIRFFARRTAGGALSTLNVTAQVTAGGRTVPVALPLLPVTSLSDGWVLTAPTPILGNLVPDVTGLLDGQPVTQVRFVLKPSANSVWQVDDFHVDPYRRH